MLKVRVSVLVVVWFMSPCITSRMEESLTKPIIREEGDFIIAGIFEIGVL